MAHTIFVRGIENWPDVNVRDKPGLKDTTVLFRAPKGWRATCDEVKPDPQGTNYKGQVYQWFHLTFENNQKGWARDDLLDMIGDCAAFGYGFYATQTYAFVASQKIASGDTPSAKPHFTEPEVCSATVRDDIAQANIRADSTTSASLLGSASAGTKVAVVGVVPGQGNDPFRWIKIRHGDIHGYMREDLLTYAAGCASLGLEPSPAPVPPPGGDPVNTEYRFDSPLKGSYSITQEFNDAHNGTDLGGNLGIGVYASGTGQVAYTVKCTKCTADKPNFASQGVEFGDPDAIKEAAWGYGYGNFVVVRHAWVDLPKAARDKLKSIGYENAYVYVRYAHLKQSDVSEGKAVAKGTRLGTLGNTGNSTGPHLHLEVRTSQSANEKGLYNRQLVNPRDVFTL